MKYLTRDDRLAIRAEVATGVSFILIVAGLAFGNYLRDDQGWSHIALFLYGWCVGFVAFRMLRVGRRAEYDRGVLAGRALTLEKVRNTLINRDHP